MGFYDAGFDSYPAFIASDHFRGVREKAWSASGKKCTLCGKKYGLVPHHLSYEVLGTRAEWRYIRFVCHRHHYWVGFFLFLFKLHNSKMLIMNYYLIKFFYLLVKSIVLFFYYTWRLLLWMKRSYAISASRKIPRRRSSW